MTGDNFLELEPGTLFMGDPVRGDKLLICYKDLIAHLSPRLTAAVSAPQSLRRVVITGTPGIGKSCFALYWLYELCRSGKTVIVQLQADFYRFSGDAVLTGYFEDFGRAGYFTDKECWFLCDPDVKQPPYEGCLGVTLVFTSPERDRYKQFLKAHKATTRYMPVWSEDELMRTREHMHEQLSADLVHQLYLQWGGIPRYVLEYAQDETQQDSLNTAITKCLKAGIGAVIGNAGEVSGSTEFLSDKVLHIQTEDFKSIQLIWASEYAFNRFVQEQDKAMKEELRAFLRTSSNMPSVATLRGYLFEPYVHKTILKGKGFQYRVLDEEAEAPFVLGPMEEKLFDCLRDLPSVEPQKYYRPTVNNLPAGDAFCVVDDALVMFQITVSLKHPVKMQGFTSIYEVASKTCDVQRCVLAFLVPPDNFRTFRAQPFHTVNNTVALCTPPHITSCTQWAVSIPL